MGSSPPVELTLVVPPAATHAVVVQGDPRQLCQRLGDVEVAQRAHLEERHVVLRGVRHRRIVAHLPLVGEMQPVTDQDLGHPWSVLKQRAQHDQDLGHPWSVLKQRTQHDQDLGHPWSVLKQRAQYDQDLGHPWSMEE